MITMRMLNRQSGMTLMEVLVAVLVLSVGLLGIAGLQVQGTRHAYDAQLHTLAVFQAQDMADRMRSNMAGVRAGKYTSVFANVGQPVATTPSLSFDELGNHWVYFGTGRLFVEGDKSSTAKQSLYRRHPEADRDPARRYQE